MARLSRCLYFDSEWFSKLNGPDDTSPEVLFETCVAMKFVDDDDDDDDTKFGQNMSQLSALFEFIYSLDMLLRYETRATQRRLRSNIENKFCDIFSTVLKFRPSSCNTSQLPLFLVIWVRYYALLISYCSISKHSLLIILTC